MSGIARRPAAAPRVVELRWQIWLPFLALAAILLSATRTDPDLWGHVRFGLDWLETRHLPSIDPYSFTQDKPWINHEWLSEALMAAAFRAAGSAGLVALKMAVIAGAVAVLWRRLRGLSPVVSASVIAIGIAGTLPLSGTVRPQIWSVLGLALLTLVLDGRRPTSGRVVGCAVLFAAWANLHGGWVTGGAALATYIVAHGIRKPADAAAWFGLGTASLAATLVNPYGIGLWRFLAATVRASRPDISEWQPFGWHESPLMWVSILAPLAIFAMLLSTRKARPPYDTSAVVLLLVAAGLKVSRVAPLICLPALSLLGPYLQSAWGPRGRLYAPSAGAAGVLLLPTVLALFAATPPIARVARCLPVQDAWAPDLAAAPSLLAASGRLVTTFDWGEYAIWHFGPSLRVSIDGRRETVYSDDVITWQRALENGDPTAFVRLSALRPEYVWLRSSSVPVRQWLAANGYRIDVETRSSFVAVRGDLHVIAPAARAAAPCFP